MPESLPETTLASPAETEKFRVLLEDDLALPYGHLTIKSSPRTGTRLAAVVPLVLDRRLTGGPMPELHPETTLASPAETEKIRVLLVDDHAVLRAGLRALLNAESDLVVVGEAEDGAQVVELAEALQPDVIVMDIQMPRMSGLDATRALRARGVTSKVLILTMHAESQYLLPLLEAGGAGYVLKSAADTELIEAIRTVQRGEVFLYPAATKLLVDGYRDRSARGEDAFDGLTEREREVLKLVAEGYSGTEIAEKLIISPKTVDTYRERIMQKLGMRHRYELVKYALKKGMLKSEPDRP